MVNRDSYMNRLIHSMWNGEIKVITGIRRCGKSVLLFDLFFEYLLSQNVSEDHILKIELDQRRYYKFRNPITLCEYVESTVRDRKDEKFYLFIDEVQLHHESSGQGKRRHRGLYLRYAERTQGI